MRAAAHRLDQTATSARRQARPIQDYSYRTIVGLPSYLTSFRREAGKLSGDVVFAT